jgi:subtilase-type serine protease
MEPGVYAHGITAGSVFQSGRYLNTVAPVKPSTSQDDGRRHLVRWAGLAGLIAILTVVALPANASAAPCPVTPGVFATAWIGGSGSLHNDLNWTNGTPSGSCDVSIATAGDYTVTMTGGANTKSFTLGGIGSTPHLVISDESPNTNLDAQPAGITIAAGASVTLTCQPGGCPGGGPDINSGSSPFANAGTITVDSETGGGAVVGGAITNTGTIAFERSGSLSGKVTNQGSILIADGATTTNSGSSCGDTGASVKNDTGGSIDGTGSGVLSVRNFEQGAGTTKDVTIPCGGTLSYTGNGPSDIRATGGFNLTGEMRAGQSLTVSAESNNTNAVLQSDFTNKGSITLTCPEGGCNGGAGGGAGFNANGKTFINAGTFTVAAASGTGAGPSGGMTNTGTMQFDQTAFLSGVVMNKGTISIANGKVAISPTEHCGNPTPRVINDVGGSIKGTGTGTLKAANFEQGAGTTSGSTPVTVDCGALKYIGTGASTIRVNSSATMTGDPAAGQTLSIAGQVNSGAFTNAGTIVFDQSSSSPTLNTGTVNNTGKIELAGPSPNTASVTGGQLEQTGAGAEIVIPHGTKFSPGAPLLLKAGTLRGAGTITGSVENSGGVVKPGDSPGTLTLGGSYVQGGGGRLEIEVDGTGAGQFDVLAVGGVATLGGTLALVPFGNYANSSAIGDSVAFLTYGGSVVNGFAQTTVNPAFSCGKSFSISNDTGAKTLKATIVSGGTACPSSTTPPPPPPPPLAAPDTKLGKRPAAKVKTKQAKAKVKFTFSATVAGSTFQCKLDKGAYKACTSPKTYKVKPGKHTFSVRAVGPGGTDATPATFKFKVVKEKS